MRSGTLDAMLNAMPKFLALLIAAALPAFPIAVTTIAVSWEITDSATNAVLCSGASNTSMNNAVVCANALPNFDGILLTVSASANSQNAATNAEANIQANYFGSVGDQSLYNVDIDIDVFAIATDLAMILGGTGDGIFQGAGFGISGASMGGFAAAEGQVKSNVCSGGDCGIQPFTFGQPFLLSAQAGAEINSLPFAGVGASAFASAFVLNDLIFDLNGTPHPGAFAVTVPEPGTFALLLLAAALWAGCKLGVFSIVGQLIRVKRSAR